MEGRANLCDEVRAISGEAGGDVGAIRFGLMRGDAMPTSHQAYRHTRLEGLFDHANLLRGRPASTTLNRRDDLNAIGRIGHRHGLVVCLTLAKWETVSGQFGGYLTG